MNYEHTPMLRLPHILTVEPPLNHLGEAKDWCLETFGPQAKLSPQARLEEYRWAAIYNTFYFRELADATMFKMKWS